jgi:hypothetical protein
MGAGRLRAEPHLERSRNATVSGVSNLLAKFGIGKKQG